jgi:hypothetical protein
VSPRALWHRAHHPPGKGSDVTTCLEAPSMPPARKGLQCCHVPQGTEPVTQLRSCHVPHGSRPAPRAGKIFRRHVIEAPGPPHGRAPVSPRILWLQTHLLVQEDSGATTCPVALGPRVCPCVPKMPDIRLIMASLGT